MPPSYRVLYDDQCEICQAGVAWLKFLDRRGRLECLPIEPDRLKSIHPDLKLEDCLQELNVVTPEGTILAGWNAVASLARLFPVTWIFGALGSIPPFYWACRAAYRFVARNRYALSKCRGGSCRIANPEDVRRKATLGAFWSCYLTGFFLRLPLAVGVGLTDFFKRCYFFLRNFRKRRDLLGGKLSVFFLGGFPCDLIPPFFGEQFVMIYYDGALFDPGSSRMRRSICRHLRRIPKSQIQKIIATHHHEEHAGNLNWIANLTGAPIYASGKTIRLLQPPRRLPWIRALMIGQTPELKGPVNILADRIETAHSRLEIFPSPGHCDDHVVFYDPQEKILLVGDTFMGTYFSTPNPDVDSRVWIQTLEKLLSMDIEIMVEGHGHIHTLRRDIPDVPGLVIRRDPKEEIREKMGNLRWISEQIEVGRQEGLPVRAIEATCFPWKHRRTWENLIQDEMTRLLSAGHFSRSELIRSFVRRSEEIFPEVYQIRFFEASPLSTSLDRPIILFDGVCNFCNTSVNFLIRRDPKGLFRFAPLQSETGKRLLERHHLSTTNLDTMVLIEGDRVSTRSTAGLKIARRLSGLWPLLCVFQIVPRPIRDAVYNVIARNRYRWWGKRDTCMIPTPGVREKFLD